MRLAFIIDPLESLKVYKDSTYAMMREAAARKHELYVLQQADLAWHDGTVTGRAQRLRLTDDKLAWYRVEAAQTTPLKAYDAVLMRKDPPFDMEYVYSTYLLESAQAQGARVFNDPRALRDYNEKKWRSPVFHSLSHRRWSRATWFRYGSFWRYMATLS